MATYRQDFHLRGHERVDFGLIVSDSYTGLTAAATQINGIFDIGTSKKDLDVDIGVQAADSIEAKMDPRAIRTQDDQDCYDFIVEAQLSEEDETKRRYIGLVMNEDTLGAPEAEDFEFRGVINAKMSAEGLDWKDEEYGDAPDPDLVWKFSAVSLEIAEILEAKLEDLVKEIVEIHAGWLSANVRDRLGWFRRVAGVDSFGHREGRYANLVALKELLQKLFDVASAEHPISVTVENSNLGIRVASADFISFSDTRQVWDPEQTRHFPQVVDFRYGDPTHFWPAFGNETYNGMDADDRGPWPYKMGIVTSTYNFSGILVSWRQLTPRDEARPVSWLPYETLGGLLYAIAFNLGGWVEWTYAGPTDLRVRVLTRQELAANPAIFVSDAVSDEIDVAPSDLVSRNAQAPACLYCHEGWPGSAYYYGQDKTFITNVDWTLDTEKPNLPLTIAPTICRLDADSFDGGVEFHKAYYNAPMPHNGIFYDGPSGDTADRERPGFPGADLSDVHTGIYMSFIAPAGDNCLGCEGQVVHRPIGAIYGRGLINGAQGSFMTHSIEGYLSLLGRTDAAAYQFERRIKVPYLTRFREDPEGVDDWRFCRPGRRIILDGREWLIAGIERDFKAGSTTIRLHVTDRIAFSEDPAAPSLPDAPPPSISMLQGGGSGEFARERFSAGSAIVRFAAVFAGPDGQIHVATADGWSYGRIIGIATSAGAPGGLVSIQRSGFIELDQDYGFKAGDRVYLRSIGSGAEKVANLSNVPLRTATVAENLHQVIGIARSPQQIEIRPERPFYVIESVPEVDFESIGEVFT